MFLLPEKVNFIEKELRKKERDETWQKVFESILKKFKNHLIGEVIEARYIQGQTVDFTCSVLEINKTLYFKYRKIALNAFTAGLIQEGVLKFYE